MDKTFKPDERTSQRLDSRCVRLWQIRLIAAVLSSSLLLLVLIELASGNTFKVLFWLWLTVSIGAILWAVVYPMVLFAVWRYQLTSDTLTIFHGWLYRFHTAIPVAHIQYVDIASGPLMRMLGVKSLRVRTAAKTWEVPVLSPDNAAHLFLQVNDYIAHASDPCL